MRRHRRRDLRARTRFRLAPHPHHLNGQVDVADPSIWATRFGSTAADFLPLLNAPIDSIASATAIPEPGTAVLLMGLGLPGRVMRRRVP